VSQKRQPIAKAALAHTKANPPVEIADYAYRELLVGRVKLLCDAHNKLIAADNVVEVAISFVVRGSFGRTGLAQARQILEPLKDMFDEKSKINPVDAKREIQEELMVIATKLWRAAAKFPLARRVQPLPCFNSGSLSLDNNGLLRGPNDSFNCLGGTTCGAAQWMYSDRSSLKKMITALDSPSLPHRLKNKDETKGRRSALKILESRGPSYINKRQCRQLGDAYFAAMCPPGSHVLTTNVEDFVPLCDAIKKDVKTP
jgi:hypothetical protein